MKTWSVFIKTCREQFRDIWVMVMSMIFAPLLILVYWLFMDGGSTLYHMEVMNLDKGYQREDGVIQDAGKSLIEKLKDTRYTDGSVMMVLKIAQNRSEAEKSLRDRTEDALLIIPEDFSAKIERIREREKGVKTRVQVIRDFANFRSTMPMILVAMALESFKKDAISIEEPIQFEDMALGSSEAVNEFSTYVPGILIFAVIVLICQVSMLAAREIERGTLKRLQISRMKSIHLLGGISLFEILMGVVSVLLTFGIAYLFGFRSRGPLWIALLIVAITALSIIGVGLIVASFSRTAIQAFVISNLPLAFFMFLSGAMFPMPKMVIAEFFGLKIGVTDFMPPSHAVVALNKIMTLGSGLGDVVYELSALVFLSLLYFGIGVLLFQKRNLSSQ